MKTTQQMSVTLPTSMATLVKAKVAAGDYASENEVIRDGVRSLLARDRAIEHWLQNVVTPACDALQAAPESVRTIAQVRARIDAYHAQPQ